MELRNMPLGNIKIVGASIEDVRVTYRAHDNIAEQLSWPLEGGWHGVFNSS